MTRESKIGSRYWGPILDDMFTNSRKVSFEDINQRSEGGVSNDVSLLFMAHRKQVWLEQEELFGDLFVRRHQ